ncbi:fasciclin domain-containing protein [Ponticoccus sp. SC2-23]|uniref:fasciclin domain-containing protein n=1 Tax=Alexandriicola marinus TaxID=2081710 RepID=UPI000FD8C34F|nr:fasciclin domain-containing protein [Alexandriicola marinus]MBM1220453.1 fasciclin domain-containing protein [Ponticoccus sp. SC6-9]MBM1225139.1 fasciclin domain-containing protein [Ponticoccus sp. SC6-15]MBM1228653.1 fasciclin domain-containing protein [Ponticoccus sp. SC6-38]MBM1233710.1 fasciclin domain-containing protein [Ponticoccus sp. SC6-45]MBM1239154.1 fasciclin domain-containing protein [Ponticoccus sp. SC6-49]MBM1242936.1 fasciclin domain-containing protein [Ponticoccus sp. SC2-
MSTVTEIALGDENFSILVDVLTLLDATIPGSDLVNTLNDPSQDLTVFAPTNDAFAALATDLGYTGDPSDTAAVTTFLVENVPVETLNDVVLYHVSAGEQFASDIAAAGQVTTLQGGTISADELPTLGDAEPDLLDPSLIATDVDATNGVVHVIDRVLLPGDLPGNDAPTFADVIAGDGFDDNSGDFDILRTAAEVAGLDAVLADPSVDLTVFAPTDAAFIALAETLGFAGGTEEEAFGFIVDALTLLGGGDPIPLLTEVLTYHVAGQSLQSSQVLAAGEVETLQGGTLTVDGVSLVDADPDIPDPNLIALDIQAANGIAHVIDGVLIPADLLASDGSGVVDFIIAGDDDDRIFTAKDADFVSGLGGDDLIVLGKGDDTGLGGDGDDIMVGGAGADLMDGGNDDDVLIGGDGNDILVGGAGDDVMIGGDGTDTFVLTAGGGHDKILDFDKADTLDLTDLGLSELKDVQISRDGGDTIVTAGDVSVELEDIRPFQLDDDNFLF